MQIEIQPLQQVFMLFYAIFWGAIANVQPRWKPFQWHLFFAVPQARCRAVAALMVLNVLPLCFFAYGMWALYRSGPTESAPLAGSLHYLIRGVLPAFAIFGFYRFWFAMVELNPDCFYASTPEALDEKYRHVEPTYRRKMEKRDFDYPTVDLAGHGWISFLSGLLYVAIASLAPWWPPLP